LACVKIKDKAAHLHERTAVSNATQCTNSHNVESVSENDTYYWLTVNSVLNIHCTLWLVKDLMI